MNPYLIIGALVSMLAVGYGGFKLGSDHEIAAQAREAKHIEQAVSAATAAAADAIAKIKVTNKTIQNEVRHETTTQSVYRDCSHTPNGLRLVNQALDPSTAFTLGSGKLPTANPAK